VDGQAPDQRPPVGGVPRGDVGTVHGDEACRRMMMSVQSTACRVVMSVQSTACRRVVMSVQTTATKHAAAW